MELEGSLPSAYFTQVQSLSVFEISY